MIDDHCTVFFFFLLPFSGPCNWKAAKLKHDFYPTHVTCPFPSKKKRNQNPNENEWTNVPNKVSTSNQRKWSLTPNVEHEKYQSNPSKIMTSLPFFIIFFGVTNDIYIKFLENCGTSCYPLCFSCLMSNSNTIANVQKLNNTPYFCLPTPFTKDWYLQSCSRL